MIKVIVKPNSDNAEIKFDEKENTYYVSLKSPPDKNKANKELVKLLSKYFKKRVLIKTGLKSKIKYIEIL
jgi:uncharacterized protein (TIGR00251 family)